MNKFASIGLGIAAVVVALVVGTQLLGQPAPGGVGGAPAPSPSATPPPSPSAAGWVGLPAGPFVVTGSDDPVQVTLDIASPGWAAMRDFDAVSKDDDGLDAPESVGGALLAWAWPAGAGINVYGEPCQWSTTMPESPATTPEGIAAAFAAQAETEVAAPMDVTVGGFAGKAVTLRVPMSYDLPKATREEKFADCDNDIFGFYGVEGEAEPARNAQGAGQIDELWILDVDGATVIIDAAYGPAVPGQLVDELRALAESATFELAATP